MIILTNNDDDDDKVDLNRNFDKGYGENSSDDPCEQDYRRGIPCWKWAENRKKYKFLINNKSIYLGKIFTPDDRGTEAFSEPEAQALRDYILNLQSKKTEYETYIDLYLSL